MSGLYYQQAKVKKPDVYGIKKRLVKKLQKEDGEDEFPVDDILSLESDTVSAAEYLTSREKTSSGLCLLHQIYSILTNNTTVDRELQEATTQSKTWRKFHIMGRLDDEYLLCKTSTYLLALNETRSADTFVFDTFKQVIDKYTAVSIKKDILLTEFQYNEKQISLLVSTGFLLPHQSTPDLFWFSIRGQGRFMSNLSNGRTEILRIIKKRNTKDIMEKLLKQKKLHKTKFSVEFLMHDLIGSGRVEKYSTAMGNLIRWTNKGEKGI